MAPHLRPLAIIATLLLAASAAQASAIRPAINDGDAAFIGGGEDATPGQFPYIVSLRVFNDRYENRHVCGGSIMNSRWILTAAHCVDFLPEQLRVQVGAHHVRDDGTAHFVQRIIVHEGYNTSTLTDDVALIQVTEPIAFGARVQPIELSADFVDGGRVATIAGWGNIYFNGPPPDHLQYLPVTTLNNRDCASRLPDLPYLPEVKDTEICVYNSRSAGACNGDSGGPAVLDGRLIGLASWTLPPCIEAGVPVVYVRLAEHLDWIAANMVPLPEPPAVV